VPMVVTMKSAAYVDAGAAEAAPEDARPYAAFLLQGGINECGAGAKPPGLFYLVNLHPYARLTASMNLLDDHNARVGVSTADRAPLSTVRPGCSTGSPKRGPIPVAALPATAGLVTTAGLVPTAGPEAP